MGCATSQQKAGNFRGSNTGESSESGFVASSTTSNRYVVSTEEDEGVATESDNTVHKNSDNNSDEMSMYTNISDFKAEKTKRKNRGGNDDGSQDIDADLNAFKNSLQMKGKKSNKRKKNLVLNNSSAKLPGTELGVYDDPSGNHVEFVGGMES